MCVFFFSSRRRHTRYWRDWSSDVCSSDLTRWVDLLECDGAKVLLSYDHPQFGRHPAVTTAVHGDGRITTDRKSVVQGKSVDLGGRRIIKKKNTAFLFPSV